MRKSDEKPAHQMFTEVGRAITGNSVSWQHQIAELLRVRRDSVGDWRSGRRELGADHEIWDKLLAMIVERRAELERVERELRAWLERHRTAAPGEGS